MYNFLLVSGSRFRNIIGTDNYGRQTDTRQGFLNAQLDDQVASRWADEGQPPFDLMEKHGKKLNQNYIADKVAHIQQKRSMESGATRRSYQGSPINASFARLQKSKQMVHRWGGEMYFVYLPSFFRYQTGVEEINREFVLHTVSELEIPIINIHKEVFVRLKLMPLPPVESEGPIDCRVERDLCIVLRSHDSPSIEFVTPWVATNGNIIRSPRGGRKDLLFEVICAASNQLGRRARSVGRTVGPIVRCTTALDR